MITLDRAAWFVGEIARPFALIWTALCAGIATLVLAFRLNDPVQAVAFVGVLYATGLAPLFLGKAAEVFGVNRNAAKVEQAKAQQPLPEKE